MAESVLVGVVVLTCLLIAWFSVRGAVRLYAAPAPRSARDGR